jgi:hypothetical protein
VILSLPFYRPRARFAFVRVFREISGYELLARFPPPLQKNRFSAIIGGRGK